MPELQALTVENRTVLDQHAEAIRVLGKRVARDIIEIGRRLIDAQGKVTRGYWEDWIKHEFGWHPTTARKFIHVYQLHIKSSKMLDLNVDVSGLYLLAAPKNEDVVDAVVDKAANGEKLSLKQVKKMIAEAHAKQDQEHTQDIERKLEALRSKYDKQVGDLRDELATSLTPKQVKKAIKEALGPLRKQIKGYEKRLKQKRVVIENVQPTNAILNALKHFSDSLVIDADAVVASEQKTAKTTHQEFRSFIRQPLTDAKKASSWLKAFLKLAGEIDAN